MRWDKREERQANIARARETRWTKKTAPPPNPNAETPQQDEAGPSTSAAPTEEAMEPPPPTPGPVPTPDMDEEILEFDDLPPSTSATPIGDLVPLSTTPTAPMDTGETTPPPLAIDKRSERIEQLEKQLKDRDDTIKFLREQVRNREALITDLRRQLDQQMAPPMAPPTSSKTPPNRGRPKKRLEELQRSARRDIVDQIVGVIDRDRSRSASRASLDRIHRDIRHKFSHYTPKKGQERKEGMDAEDGLLLLAQLGTQKAYKRMKATLRLIGRNFNVLPPLEKVHFSVNFFVWSMFFWVIAIKRRICAELEYDEIPTPSGPGFCCSDIARALKFRLSTAKDNLIPARDLPLKISGDHGQGFTKLTISLAHAVRPNSPSNNFVVAVFPAKDSRKNLKFFCGSLWEQIQQISEIDGRKVKWFLGGDLCFLWAVIGHCGSAMTAFPSPVCDCRKEHLISAEKCQLRSVQELERQADQFQQLTQGGDKATAEARALTMGIVCAPLLPSISFEQMLLAPFHVFQGLGNALIKELEVGENAEIAQQFFRRIGARREAFRKRDMTGNSIRKILIHADQMEALFETEWAKTICQTMAHLGKIQIFTKAQLLSPGDLDGLETAIDQFKAFLDEQPMVRTLLSKKTKAHLLLHHFVPFARQHKFLGLLDEQGDEALHSVWRRLEQLWKTMPDAEQMRQQLEHHFVSNWLMDTGRLDELKLREEERREQAAEEKTNEESDQDADIDVVD
ncbi:hypothetical protein niasHS_007961 [Heterodera schachtii]|uniref:Uncharacterized protein n=1 Tax=Heterodera schachtii TaxID=97005 RepID=A0ABD2JQA9_HETSC